MGQATGYARAVARMSKEGRTGAVTVFDVAPAYLSAAAPEDLRAHLEAHLARFKIPKYLVLTDALPRNATGKVRRFELRAQAATEFADPR